MNSKAENGILGIIVKNLKEQRILKIRIVCLLEKCFLNFIEKTVTFFF